jgi:carboxypeptidase Taq
MPNSNKKYEVYKNKLQEIADIKFSAAVLQWDQETYLPRKGNEIRGRQISTLSEFAHKEFTTDNMGNLLNELLSVPSLNDNQRRNVELSKEDYERSKKLPALFVRKMSDAVNKSFHSWIQARKENDFSCFQDPLQTIIDLKRQEADLIGYQDHPYSALMNEYDKGLNVQFTDNLFSTLIPELSLTMEKIKNKPEIPNDFLHKNYDKNLQWKFGIDLLKFMH